MPTPSGNTIIFLGGPSATGKSSLARALGACLDARVIDTDLFWMALRRAIPPEAAPDLHFFTRDESWLQPIDELVQQYLSVARFVCNAIENVVTHYAAIGTTAVIEGCWVLPDFAVQAGYAGCRFQAQRRALFLYEPSPTALATRLATRENGGQPPPPKYIH